MKSSPSNKSQYCAPIIEISSLSLSSREEIGRLYSDLTGSSVSNSPRSQFIILKIPADQMNANGSKPNRSMSVRVEPGSDQKKPGKIEARATYDEYREYFEKVYTQKKRETEEYGAKTYAAQKTIEKIKNERSINLSVRQILDAMRRRL